MMSRQTPTTLHRVSGPSDNLLMIHPLPSLPPLLKEPFPRPPPEPPQPIHLILTHPKKIHHYRTSHPLLTQPEQPIHTTSIFSVHQPESPRLAPVKIRQILANPDQPHANCRLLFMADPLVLRGSWVPAHVPDTSDLHGLPKVLKILLNWLLNRDLNVDQKEILPESLIFLLDPAPILPQYREISQLNSTSAKEFQWRSFTNSLIIFRTTERLRQVDIWMDWTKVLNRDHRIWFSTLTASIEQIYSPKLGRQVSVIGDESPRAQQELIDTFLTQTGMSILAWNCRGIERPSFRNHINHLVTTHKPDIVILSETRIPSPSSDLIAKKLPFDSWVTLDPVGFSGGIMILWNSKDVRVTVVNKTDQLFNVVVQGTIKCLTKCEDRLREKVHECSCGLPC